jgi:protease I
MSLPALVLLPEKSFDPTEVSVPWGILRAAGTRVVFATPNGKRAEADPVMVTGEGLGILRPFLRAARPARERYSELTHSEEFGAPLSWSALASPESFSGLLLPGGHQADGMRPYLESQVLQKFVASFAATGKPLAAICHGVVLAARSLGPDGRSILHGRKVTALPRWMELSAWAMTCTWMGGYYRTYRGRTVEGEVRSVLADPQSDFDAGPRSNRRDTADHPERGFVVRDRNLLTARWPGDAHRFGQVLVTMIKEKL